MPWGRKKKPKGKPEIKDRAPPHVHDLRVIGTTKKGDQVIIHLKCRNCDFKVSG